MNSMWQAVWRFAMLIAVSSCATVDHGYIQLTASRLDSSTIIVEVCNLSDYDEFKIPRFSRRQLIHSSSAGSVDTLDIVWFPQRYKDVVVLPGNESFDDLATDSCMFLLVVDGHNMGVSYLRCINLFGHGGTLLLKVPGVTMYHHVIDDHFVGGLGRR